MARTIVEWESARRPSQAKVVNIVKEMYEADQGNADKTDNEEDNTYYEGRMDSLADLLYTYGWKVKQ